MGDTHFKDGQIQYGTQIIERLLFIETLLQLLSHDCLLNENFTIVLSVLYCQIYSHQFIV